MVNSGETIQCSHCGAPMLPTHSGPCFVCGKLSDTVVPNPEPPPGNVKQRRIVLRRYQWLLMALFLLLVGATVGTMYVWQDDVPEAPAATGKTHTKTR